MRLFVALELPERPALALHAWACRVAPGLRVLPPRSLHVTLQFLGERPDAETEAIGDAVAAAARPVPGLRIGAPAAFGRGRVLVVELDDPKGGCAALAAAIGEGLAGAVGHRLEARALRPHVSVARGTAVRARGLDPPPDPGPFSGRAVTLMRSRLSPQGAAYEAVRRVSLPA